MTALAQARHVLAKDIREFRWILALYAAVVVFATARAAAGATSGAYGLTMYVVVAVGLLVVASTVLADSPTRSDAFWATHPLRPTAVIGAKALLATLLLTVGLVGQAIAMRAFDLPLTDIVTLLGASVVAYGVWLLCTMLIAALVPDMRSVMLGVIGVLVAAVVVIIALTMVAAAGPVPWGAPIPEFVASTLAVVGMAGSVLMLVWLYRVRDTRLAPRVLGFTLAALAAVMGQTVTGTDGDAGDVPETPSVIPLTLEHNPRAPIVEPAGMHFALRGAALPDGVHQGFEPVQYVVRLRNGSELAILPRSGMIQLGSLMFQGAPRPLLDGVRWIDAEDRPYQNEILIPLTPEERRTMEAGVAGIVVYGQMIVTDARPIGAIPLTVGAELVKEGRRVRVMEWKAGAEGLSLRLESQTIGARGASAAAVERFINTPILAALVNDARGEAVMLSQQGAGGSINALVIPGVPFRSGSISFGLQPPYGRPRGAAPDPAWLRDARLVIVTVVLRGRYPVRAELAIP